MKPASFKPSFAAALAAALLVFAAGCDSLLEEPEPSTAISQEVALSDPDAVRGIRASMYGRFHNATAMNTDWLLGPSALADNTYFRSGQNRHAGLNRFNQQAGIGTGTWNNLYNVINDANVLLNGVEEGVLPTGEMNKLRAEAYFFRALTMHHGVRIFGYDPNGNGGVVSPNSGPGSGFNLGIVIRTEPTLSPEDATDKARATVTEVYSQIESDLSEALSLMQGLSSDVKEQSQFYVSEAAIQALMARVNLYQRDWSAADSRAQNAIDLAGSAFGSELAAPDSASVRAIFDETNGNPEAIFTIEVDPQTESAGVNNSLAAFTAQQYIAQVPTQDLLSLYPEDDPRVEAWYGPCVNDVSGNPYTGCQNINDAGFELQKYASEQGVSLFADNYIHFRIAEMVLIQAEARLNTSGPGAAMGRLNDLREQRGVGDLSATGFDDAYDTILNSRRRELVAEGHRFFDLKRLGRDIEKVQGISDVPFTEFKILDDLPESALAVNEELVQNPGYSR